MPHAQSDRDVSHLAMQTARIKGRILDTGCGFLSHRKVQQNTRVTEVARRGRTAHTWVQVCGRAHHSSDAEGVKQHPKWQSYTGSPTYDYTCEGWPFQASACGCIGQLHGLNMAARGYHTPTPCNHTSGSLRLPRRSHHLPYSLTVCSQ